MNTDTLELEELELKEIISKEHQIVLYNDDVNTFDYVIELLIDVCKHAPLQAEQCATLVHYHGKCVIKKGPFKTLNQMHLTLSEKGLTTEVN